jgi:hypothetical protein
MEDYVLFYDGSKNKFIKISFEELKLVVCPEDLEIKGILVTHKNYKGQLDALIKESVEPDVLEDLVDVVK